MSDSLKPALLEGGRLPDVERAARAAGPEVLALQGVDDTGFRV